MALIIITELIITIVFNNKVYSIYVLAFLFEIAFVLKKRMEGVVDK